jgi:probable rRNA maturation factor
MAVAVVVTRLSTEGTVVGPPGAEALVERAAGAALRDRGVEEGELSIAILDDDGMAAMNRQWKGREGPTDVLAFALHEPGAPVVGDIYLGIERAAAQAVEEGEPVEHELARLAIHATLHVLGWDHPEEERESSEMWAMQERILGEVGT